MEPAAILVRAFQVNVGGPRAVFLAQARRDASSRNRTTRRARRSSFCHFAAPHAHFVPGGSSSSAECVYQASAPSRSKNGRTCRSASTVLELLAARLAIKNDQRHAPEALARNAPVGPLGNHVVDALFAPLGLPFHFGDFGERLSGAGSSWSSLDEPLLGGAEDHGIVAAPAVRIAVREFAFAHEHAALLQQLDDDRVRFENRLALVFRQAFDESAVVILRRVGFEAVFLAGAKVVGAMAGRGVHDSAALIERDVLGEHAGHCEIEKRMLELRAFEFPALPAAGDAADFEAQFGCESIARALSPAAVCRRTCPRPHIRIRDETRARGWQAASREWWSRSER